MCAWSSLPSCWRSSPSARSSRTHIPAASRRTEHARAPAFRFRFARRACRLRQICTDEKALSSPSFQTHAATNSCRRGIPSASTRRLRRVSSAPSAPTPESLIKSGLNSTASITASSMTLMHSSRLSASKPQRNNGAAREQNPHHSHYNGLKGRPAGRPLRSRFSVLLPCPAHRRDFPLIYGHISPCA